MATLEVTTYRDVAAIRKTFKNFDTFYVNVKLDFTDVVQQ